MWRLEPDGRAHPGTGKLGWAAGRRSPAWLWSRDCAAPDMDGSELARATSRESQGLLVSARSLSVSTEVSELPASITRKQVDAS